MSYRNKKQRQQAQKEKFRGVGQYCNEMERSEDSAWDSLTHEEQSMIVKAEHEKFRRQIEEFVGPEVPILLAEERKRLAQAGYEVEAIPYGGVVLDDNLSRRTSYRWVRKNAEGQVEERMRCVSHSSSEEALIEAFYELDAKACREAHRRRDQHLHHYESTTLHKIFDMSREELDELLRGIKAAKLVDETLKATLTHRPAP